MDHTYQKKKYSKTNKQSFTLLSVLSAHACGEGHLTDSVRHSPYMSSVWLWVRTRPTTKFVRVSCNF